MTVGNPTKLILNFAFPLILANLGQQLYLIVDTAIVGRALGVEALAAVGCTTWIYGLISWSITALTNGFSTFVSRYFGMDNKRLVAEAIGASVSLSVICALVLTVLGLVFTKPLLVLLKTPPEILNDSATYMYTMIAGTLIVTGFNLTSAILRAFGDGRSPMIAMVIAAVLNVVLDLLFIVVIPMGVFGAAFATVISQLVSFIYAVIRIGKIEYIKLTKNDFKLKGHMPRDLMLFGLPLALQNAILSIGGIVLQSTVNLEGSIFIAGYTATNKLYGLLECTAISLGFSITTYLSQNYGAKRFDRVRDGFKTSAVILTVTSVIITAVTILLGKPLLSLFIDKSEAGAPESLAIAYEYLFIMAISLVILYLLYLYRSTLQALGDSFWSMASGFGEFAVRAFMAKVTYLWWGAETIYYIEPAAWLGALVFVLPTCYYYLKKFGISLKKDKKSV